MLLSLHQFLYNNIATQNKSAGLGRARADTDVTAQAGVLSDGQLQAAMRASRTCGCLHGDAMTVLCGALCCVMVILCCVMFVQCVAML
jgi:hypothetical protein